MSRRVTVCGGFVLWMAVCYPVVACLWDEDTILMERRRFPQILEMITGKFLRHSPEFYQWRVEDREERLKEDPSPELYDDLAVAYEKLGNHEKAISLTLEKQTVYPGMYTTHANLGTFYLHNGQFEAGLTEIRAAIDINPDAHFGREVYQQRLVEYLLSKQTNGKTTLPLSRQHRSEMRPTGFAEFLMNAEDIGDAPGDNKAMFDSATKGVLGMMRFGNYDSPVLLEALGDLLLSQGYPADAKQMAARAYLKASYEADGTEAEIAYRKLAKEALFNQIIAGAAEGSNELQVVETHFASEVKDANAWYSGVVKDELQWIADGRDVDAAFAEKYFQEPEIEGTGDESLLARVHQANRIPLVVASVGLAIAALVALFWIRSRRTRASQDASVS